MLETTPDRLSYHSFGIIVRSRAAVAIAKIPVMIDHAAMNDSTMSVICAVHLVRFSSLPLPDGRMIHHRVGHVQVSRKSVACVPNSVWYWNRKPCPESGQMIS